ncbi:MAG: hypothetical protein DMF63_10905 [Acidobacteria bacterium]|nr:MAG: hypothetical protein DMF63_10905 [Acidobacteriota bacterium]
MMRNLLLGPVFLIAGLGSISCQVVEQATVRRVTPTNTLVISTNAQDATDFANFAFPQTEQWESFVLKNGGSPFIRGSGTDEGQMGYSLIDVSSGDLKGLTKPTLVVVSVTTGGSATPLLVYLFDLKDEQPKVAWSMVSGDRAEGGLRRAFLSDGKLQIEVYESENSRGDCCPQTYATLTFELRDGTLSQTAESHLLPNPKGSANFYKSGK